MIVSTDFPSQESVNEFFDGVNEALRKFRAANPDVPVGIVCGSAFNIMLNFAHTWMENTKMQHLFVDFVTKEAQHFVKLKETYEKEVRNG